MVRVEHQLVQWREICDERHERRRGKLLNEVCRGNLHQMHDERKTSHRRHGLNKWQGREQFHCFKPSLRAPGNVLVGQVEPAQDLCGLRVIEQCLAPRIVQMNDDARKIPFVQLRQILEASLRKEIQRGRSTDPTRACKAGVDVPNKRSAHSRRVWHRSFPSE